METGLVERVLRDLPGVLDCSVHDEGIAIVVHPEIDPRMMELRAQVALAEIGERRPLLVVGGMSSGRLAEPPPAPDRPPRRLASRSPMSLVGFAILVVALLTVVPIAGGGGKGSPRLPTVAAPSSLGAPSFGSLPVVDEPSVIVAAASVVAGPVAPAVRGLAHALRSAAPSSPVSMGGRPPATHAVAPAADAPARDVGVAAKGNGKGKVSAHGQGGGGKGKGKAKADGAKVRAASARGRR